MNIKLMDEIILDDEKYEVIEVTESEKYVYERLGNKFRVFTVVLKNEYGSTVTMTKEIKE